MQLDGEDAKPDPEMTEILLKQLTHAERYTTTQDQQQKIVSLQSILR